LAAALVLVGIYFVIQPARRSAQAESHPLPGRQLIRGGLIALLTAIIYGLECVIIS
jgi:drug/metabolite transporter (DMT)-like permease